MPNYALRDETGSPTVIPLSAILTDENGDPITNGAATISIQRKDNLYLNFVASTWGASAVNNAMSVVSVGNSPGQFFLGLDTDGLGLGESNELRYVVKDANSNAENVPSYGGDSIGGGLAHQNELGANFAVGKAVYDANTSELKLYRWDDPTVLIATHDMKDSNGDPAGLIAQFAKIPK